MIDINLVKKLREKTGVGFLDCQNALSETGGDLDMALEVLRKRGQKIAAIKAERSIKVGIIGIYIHSNERIAAMVELGCETDFVAKNKEFKELAHDLAMQIAATNPLYLKPDDIPLEVVKKEKEIIREEMSVKGGSAVGKKKIDTKVLEKIIEGKLEKFYETVCLLKQPFIKDQSIIIEDLIKAKIAKLGENIQVRRFARFEV